MDTYPIAPKMNAEMNILKLPVNQVGVPEVLAFFEKVILSGEKAIVLSLNVNCVNLALKHAWLNQFINQVQLVYCDGDGVRMGLKILGYEPPPKITYNVWLWQIAEFSERKGFTLFFLGAKPGIAEEAKERLLQKYARLKVVGVHHGYFRKSGAENEQVLEIINQAKPDILLVCFGMPEQEQWIRDNYEKTQAHVFIKGGAALDYASGRLKKAPDFLISMKLEWFYRLLQEPRRLFKRYVIGNIYFLFKVLLEKWGVKLKYERE